LFFLAIGCVVKENRFLSLLAKKKKYKCLCKTDETRLSIGDPSNGALAAGRGIFVVKAGFVKLNPE